MVTTEGYMFFPPLVESDGETQKLKKLNHHSFFGNPFYHWLSGHCKKILVLFAQDLSKFSIRPAESKKIPLNPPLQKGEAIELPGLIEMLPD